ncbi:MAG: hypothetical protein WAM89_08785 [Terriglobales bacterium]
MAWGGRGGGGRPKAINDRDLIADDAGGRVYFLRFEQSITRMASGKGP